MKELCRRSNSEDVRGTIPELMSTIRCKVGAARYLLACLRWSLHKHLHTTRGHTCALCPS